MLFDDFFFHASLAYSSFFLFFLPLLGCLVTTACTKPDGIVTVSKIVHRGPLATTYAYVGALFLFNILYCQNEKTKERNLFKFMLAFAAAKCLSVPLVLPLDSVRDDSYHDVFFLIGGLLECLFQLVILAENRNAHKFEASSKRRSAFQWYVFLTLVLVLSVVIGGVFAWSTTSWPYVVLFLEYSFGVALVGSTFIQHIFVF